MRIRFLRAAPCSSRCRRRSRHPPRIHGPTSGAQGHVVGRSDRADSCKTFWATRIATAKKTDKKLENPRNGVPPQDQKDITERNIKTRDGRILRQVNEDPELRPDDSVMIEMRPVDDVCERYNLGPNALQKNGAGNQQLAERRESQRQSLGSLTGAALSAAAGGTAAVPGLNGANGASGISASTESAEWQAQSKSTTTMHSTNWFDLTRCPLPTDKPKTDDEKSEQEKFQRRILAANPYKLNRFGVLELPGLPAMPLSGLTASEATKRLAADPRAQRFLRAHDAVAPEADRRRGAQAVRLRPVRGSSQYLRAGVGYPGAGRLHRGSRRHPGRPALRQRASNLRTHGGARRSDQFPQDRVRSWSAA